MRTSLVHLVAAARPNFMKIAPLYHALKRESWCATQVVHTGQHYDPNMSEAFFRDLGVPQPDINLEVGSGTHAEQTAGVMVAYEKLCLAHRPDWVVVVGDVNSTMACTLVAKKLHLPVAHLEAGLRSFDRSMPEEINRLVTDSISDLLWTPSPDADENLAREGIAKDKVIRVGNIMIDALELVRPKIEVADTAGKLGLEPKSYGVVTIHRPVNVDNKDRLAIIVDGLVELAGKLPLVFPIHPRTRVRLEAAGLMKRLDHGGIRTLEPQGYVDFMSLLSQSAIAVTDSGGIQEETTYLGIPCVTLRENTERPITVTQGTNRLSSIDALAATARNALLALASQHRRPDLWDGKTASRVAASLKAACGMTA